MGNVWLGGGGFGFGFGFGEVGIDLWSMILILGCFCFVGSSSFCTQFFANAEGRWIDKDGGQIDWFFFVLWR